jgi:hypothetical protein
VSARMRALVEAAARDGIKVTTTPNGIRLSGEHDLVEKWRAVLQRLMPAIVKERDEDAALTGGRAAIWRWLLFLGEHDPAIFATVEQKMATDPEARDYFLNRSGEVPPE